MGTDKQLLGSPVAGCPERTAEQAIADDATADQLRVGVDFAGFAVDGEDDHHNAIVG